MAICPVLIPILSEWLALSNQSFTEWKRLSTAVLQLFCFQLDSFSNQMWEKLSNGKVRVPAKLSNELAGMNRIGLLENYDVVYILKTMGNPYMGQGEIEVVSTHLIFS